MSYNYAKGAYNECWAPAPDTSVTLCSSSAQSASASQLCHEVFRLKILRVSVWQTNVECRIAFFLNVWPSHSSISGMCAYCVAAALSDSRYLTLLHRWQDFKSHPAETSPAIVRHHSEYGTSASHRACSAYTAEALRNRRRCSQCRWQDKGGKRQSGEEWMRTGSGKLKEWREW